MHGAHCMRSSLGMLNTIPLSINMASTSAAMRCQVYSELFSDGTPERMDQLFRYLDKDGTGYIDYLSWSRRIRLQVQLCTLPLHPF